jgi:hypothetical protein
MTTGMKFRANTKTTYDNSFIPENASLSLSILDAGYFP